jgi:SAM-dependent methyltransferase
VAHLKGKERSDYVRGMFDRIAARYDLLNRIISGGQDMKWRRFVVEVAALPPDGKLLDIATGTGDIAFEALKQSPGAQAVGADFALGMMRVGAGRDPFGRSVDWTGADALALPYASESFDAVASGFLMRNVVDIPRALSEQWRVLKPGGVIGCREMIYGSSFTRPDLDGGRRMWDVQEDLLTAADGHPQMGRNLKNAMLEAGFAMSGRALLSIGTARRRTLNSPTTCSWSGSCRPRSRRRLSSTERRPGSCATTYASPSRSGESTPAPS